MISIGDGSNNYIARITDGGQSYQIIVTYGGASAGKFFFLKDKINGEYYGWMYYPGSFIFRSTTNSGLTWNTLPEFSGSFNSIFFVNKDTGWATSTSSNNYVSYTTNGGVNWLQQSLSSSVIQYDIYFVNPRKGWIGKVFNNYILATSDGGNTWGRQSVPIIGASKLFFLDSLIGWCGDGNPIAHTTNGGGTITSIISGSTETQKDYRLYQNFPNPFNPITNVKFSILNAGHVKIVVYDIQGREVQTLVNETLKPGTYETTFDGSMLNSGIYFYKLIANGFTDTKKMLLLK
jgi:hypothetical protein